MHTGFVRAAISLCEIVLLSCLNATRQSVPQRQLQSVQPFMLRDPGALKHPELLSVCLSCSPSASTGFLHMLTVCLRYLRCSQLKHINHSQWHQLDCKHVCNLHLVTCTLSSRVYRRCRSLPSFVRKSRRPCRCCLHFLFVTRRRRSGCILHFQLRRR